jgi:molybdopterin synthase sulfur carrier subunit
VFRRVDPGAKARVMRVRVRFFTRLKEVVGRDELELDVEERADVGVVLRKLSERYGEKFAALLYEGNERMLATHLQVLLDGSNVLGLNGLKTRLKGGSELAIIPLIMGG